MKKKQQLSKKLKSSINSHVCEKIKASVMQNGISCNKAHNISNDLEIDPKIVGAGADMLGIKLNKCQLGLFGCNNVDIFKDGLSNKVSPQLKKCLMKIEKNGKLDCKDIWNLSKTLNLEKMIISAACESLGIKISKCQLGAF